MTQPITRRPGRTERQVTTIGLGSQASIQWPQKERTLRPSSKRLIDSASTTWTHPTFTDPVRKILVKPSVALGCPRQLPAEVCMSLKDQPEGTYGSGIAGWLYPRTDHIVSFAPFNNLPTHYRITIDGRQKWFGQ